METPPQTFAVLIPGQKTPMYFDADSWRVDEGILRLSRGDSVVAMFSVYNIVGLVDLNAGAHLAEAVVKERFKQKGLGKKVVNVELLSRPIGPRPGDDITTS